MTIGYSVVEVPLCWYYTASQETVVTFKIQYLVLLFFIGRHQVASIKMLASDRNQPYGAL